MKQSDEEEIMAESKSRKVVAHPGILSCYFVLILAFLLIVIYQIWRGYLLPTDLSSEQTSMLRLIIYTFCFGGLGGTTYSIYGLYKHTSEKDYDPSYFYWYIFRSPLGAVLGMILFFLLKGGLMVVSPESTQTAFQAKALFVSAAFLAGFSVNQFIVKLKQLSQTIWGVKGHKD
ncbi:hypothetical protein BVX98_01550 [bacterium F11]|nr:hypothetical protein BVX98_01550 [bacterium F11]